MHPADAEDIVKPYFFGPVVPSPIILVFWSPAPVPNSKGPPSLLQQVGKIFDAVIWLIRPTESAITINSGVSFIKRGSIHYGRGLTADPIQRKHNTADAERRGSFVKTIIIASDRHDLTLSIIKLLSLLSDRRSDANTILVKIRVADWRRLKIWGIRASLGHTTSSARIIIIIIIINFYSAIMPWLQRRWRTHTVMNR